MQDSNTYDFIFAGGGLAGLSLAYYCNKEESLRHKKILIIDRDAKETNDHTWCFWEKGVSPFEEIVFRKWSQVWFHGTNNFSKLLQLGEYQYKMIRGIDFYEYVIPILEKNPNITFVQASVLETENPSDTKSVKVKTDCGDFWAKDFVFDSAYRSNYQKPQYQNMLQHFKGWVIETEEPVFQPDEPTLFDFRTEQKTECRFVYVMPHSDRKAIVEYTVFSDNLIQQSEYEHYLIEYIEDKILSKLPELEKSVVYSIKEEEYKIDETEFGIIPMSDEPHIQIPAPKVIRIGTAGGYVKASTGYSFQRQQRRLQKLTQELVASNSDFYAFEKGKESWKKPKYIPSWKSLLDTILLRVMLTKKHSTDDIFTNLFKYNSTEKVLKFLDEDTTFWQDITLITTVPIMPFVKAALEIIGRVVRGK